MKRISLAMTRYHAPTQVAVLVTLVVALALTGGALLIAVGVSSVPHYGDLAGGGAILSELAASIMGWTIALTCIATIFLTTSTVSFSLGTRTREIALLRLAGARPGQVSAALITEHALLGAVAGALGGLLSWPVAAAARSLLVGAGFAPADLQLTLQWWIVPAVAGIGLLLAGVGAIRPARKAARVDPMLAVSDAVPPRRALSWVRVLIGVTAAVGAGYLATSPVKDPDGYMTETIGLVVLAVMAAAALAPLLVPAVTWVLGTPLAALWRGPGKLAVEQTRYGAARAASLAMPILLVLGMAGGVSWTIWGANSAGRGENTPPPSDVVLYSQVGTGSMSAISGAPQTSGPDGTTVRSALAAQPGISAWTATTTLILPASTPQSASTTLTLAAMDIPGATAMGYLSNLSPADPTSSPAAAASTSGTPDPSNAATQPGAAGTASAAAASSPATVDVVSVNPDVAPLGSTLTVTTGDGERVSLRVTSTAQLSGPIWASVLITPQTAAQWGVTWVDAAFANVTAGTNPATVRDALAASLHDVTVRTGPQDVTAQRQANGQQTIQALISLLAAVVIMAGVALVTTSLSAAHERRRETQVLVRTGASRSQVMGTAALQSLLVVAVATLAAAGAMACAYVRLRTMLGAPPAVPWLAICGGVGVAVILALVTTLVGTWRALARATATA